MRLRPYPLVSCAGSWFTTWLLCVTGTVLHRCVTALCHMQELDSQDPMHKEFWEALMVIAEVELQEAVKQDELDWARLRGEPIPAKYTVKEAGLHEAVDSDVQMMLAGATP